ncbi:hypothetical protein [Hymenobacter mucosus]|uniref:Uncharacterized protein n=1 Tax=Hymenobacter mucosus TaxID=1411120 RepID=A0A238YLE3_9BACT|nr:hypothetical protein [Hymenobacter mucosus]SNR71443.1 hypothetical protein SAMN06269173_105306 [Hymenobacter mucosus]
MMRAALTLLFFLLLGAAQAAAPPQLVLDVARFRNENVAVKGAVVEVYATVSGQSLTYKRRGPKLFQAAATVTLELIRPDGAAVYQETVLLKPPVLRDTTAVIKNPISFQKRIVVPDGSYVLRGQVRDQYKGGTANIVEVPLVLQSTSIKPVLSDIVLLAKPASRTIADGNNFIRNGFSLTRAPGGLYARGADKVYFYSELHNATSDQPLTLRYRLRTPTATKDLVTSTGSVTGASGKPTVVSGEVDISKVPAGEYVLLVEVRNAKNQLLASQTAKLSRNPDDYAPAGAVMP